MPRGEPSEALGLLGGPCPPGKGDSVNESSRVSLGRAWEHMTHQRWRTGAPLPALGRDSGVRSNREQTAPAQTGGAVDQNSPACAWDGGAPGSCRSWAPQRLFPASTSTISFPV